MPLFFSFTCKVLIKIGILKKKCTSYVKKTEMKNVLSANGMTNFAMKLVIIQ